MKFLLWLLLLAISPVLALLALVLYPLLWLLSIPFRILGFAMDGLLQGIRELFLLPARLLRGPAHH
ncbi:MAG TPA: hypothetical protein PK916_02860 [Bacteroidota bacterium]|nr:hypothetical protein [Bacteroidota bacterium]